jgi:hypothetical protein
VGASHRAADYESKDTLTKRVGAKHKVPGKKYQATKYEIVKIQLTKLAHARSGDKGDTANVGLIALRDEFYPILVREVTAERVKQHFKGICKGEVERFELANLGALNFLLHESLGGGGTLSLMTDAQGKTFSTALLRMQIEILDEEARRLELG